MASPRSISTWLAFFLIFWVVGFLLQWPIRESRIQRWQSQLASTAKKDFEVIERLKSEWESKTELDSILNSIGKGMLVWNTDADQGKQDSSQREIYVNWQSEPGGYRRLKLEHDWQAPGGKQYSVTMIRRYSDADLSGVVGAPWVLAHFFGLFGAVIGFMWVKGKSERAQEEDWINRFSTQIGVSQESLKAKEWMGVRESLAHGIYAMADSMKSQIASVSQTYERSSQAMTSMPIGILTFNEKLKLDFANPAGKALLGIELAEIGQRLIEVVRIPEVFDCILATHETGKPNEIECQMNQGRISLRLKAIPIGQVDPATSAYRVLVSIADETRLKQLENLRRDFTANVSHELKTPLASIKAYAETLLMGALDDPDARQHFIMRIEEQACRLEALIADLLQLSRLQSQPDKPALIPISIQDVINSCVDDHSAIAQRLKVSVNIGTVYSGRILSDLSSLKTILANIVSNAIRYNKPNGSVSISTRELNGQCIVRIEDSGIGIPPEDLERIFERFYRVEKARSQETGGTGLGLAIVKHLCQLVTAELNVKSRLGEGSCFEISFPMPH
ncbi:MAG: ATP-binding protein [Pirellula sp.]